MLINAQSVTGSTLIPTSDLWSAGTIPACGWHSSNSVNGWVIHFLVFYHSGLIHIVYWFSCLWKRQGGIRFYSKSRVKSCEWWVQLGPTHNQYPVCLWEEEEKKNLHGIIKRTEWKERKKKSHAEVALSWGVKLTCVKGWHCERLKRHFHPQREYFQ